jgi:hypothetical protein
VAPTTIPSSFPSSPPTSVLVYDQAPDPTLVDSEEDDDDPRFAATYTVFAIVAGLASSIVVCSLFLYASDLRDRYKHEQLVQQQQEELNGPLDDDNSSQKSMQNSKTTSVPSTDAEGGYYITARLNNEIVEYRGADNRKNNILPPMMLTDGREYFQTELRAIEAAPHDDDDGRSISRVSTLTTSLVEGGYGGYTSYADIEEKKSRRAIESSSAEPSDNHRVTDQTNLKELVANAAKEGHPSDENDSTVAENNDASVCSSLTNGSNTPSGSPKLLGEHCLERESMSSLEFSPDTPQLDESPEKRGEDGHEVAKKPRAHRVQENDNQLSQLEQLVARIPFVNKFGGVSSPQAAATAASTNDDAKHEAPEDEPPVVPAAATDGCEEDSYVRDIYFVPCTEECSPSLGLELSDAKSPEAWTRVIKVEDLSPLVGRIFVGDLILSVNDIDTAGRSSKNVLELLEKTHAHVDGVDESSVASSRMTKLTVIGAESDNGSLSDGQQSFDLGQPESGVEV